MVFYPHGGGVRITPLVQRIITERVQAYATKKDWYGNFQLRLRFKGQFCYIDASGKDGDPFPICRLRHFSEDRFSLAFYTYSNEKYSPCY